MTVVKTSKTVIENRLLAALDEDKSQVAILATQQDLEDMIAALYGYEIGEFKDNVLSWSAHLKRRKDLAKGMSQLLREAFPDAGK